MTTIDKAVPLTIPEGMARLRPAAAMSGVSGDVVPFSTDGAYRLRPSHLNAEELMATHAPFILLRGDGALIVRKVTAETLVLDTQDGSLEVSRASLEGEALRVLLRDEDSEEASGIDRDTGPVRWLLRYLMTQQRGTLTGLAMAAGLSNLCLIALPLFIMSVYDRVIPHGARESLVTLAIGISIVLCLDLGLRHARLQFIDALGLKLSAALNAILYRRLLTLRSTARPASPAAIAAAPAEVEGLSLLLPEVMIGVVIDLSFCALVLIAVAALGGWVVVGPILGAVSVMVLTVCAARSLRRASTKTAELREGVLAQITSTWDGLDTVKATGAEGVLQDRFEQRQAALALATHKARHRMRYASSASQVIVQLTVVVTLCLGVMRVDGGAMTIGALAAITLFVSRAIAPIAQVTDQILRLRALSPMVSQALTRLSASEPAAGDEDSCNSKRIRGDLSLRNVSVRYNNDQMPALDQLSLEFPLGAKIGFVGKNGAGKSTLINVLSRMVEPTSGRLLVDGADAHQLAPNVLRQSIAYAPQETVLFPGTLRENVCLGRATVDEPRLAEVLRLSGVDRIAAHHPNGLSLEVGPRGAHLSGGERQAVGLARALLKDAPILLLDEPTSQMDQTLEDHVIRGLAAATTGKTLIVSTHRLRLLSIVDRVVALDAGRVIADGPRDVVLTQLSAAPQKAA